MLPLDSPELEKEYDEFKRKVEEALDALSNGSYWQVAYNAYRTLGDILPLPAPEGAPRRSTAA